LESSVKTFSVIIPTYRRPVELDRLLTDLEKQKFEKLRERVEVIIVTENPDEDTLNVINSHEEKSILDIVKIIFGRKLGLPGARNRGIEKARGEFLIFLDDDVRIDENFLKECERYSELKNFCFRIEGVKSHLLDRIFVGKMIFPLGLVFAGFGEKLEKIVEISHLPGACFIVRRGSGLIFDEKLGEGNAYLEDCDFSFRLRKLGEKLYYVPFYSIKHMPPESGGCREPDYRRWLRYYWSHKSYFIRKNGSSACLIAAFFVAFLECFYLSVSKGRNFFKELFRGWREGILGKLE